jgi:hypothetical protein
MPAGEILRKQNPHHEGYGARDYQDRFLAHCDSLYAFTFCDVIHLLIAEALLYPSFHELIPFTQNGVWICFIEFVTILVVRPRSKMSYMIPYSVCNVKRQSPSWYGHPIGEIPRRLTAMCLKKYPSQAAVGSLKDLSRMAFCTFLRWFKVSLFARGKSVQILDDYLAKHYTPLLERSLSERDRCLVMLTGRHFSTAWSLHSFTSNVHEYDPCPSEVIKNMRAGFNALTRGLSCSSSF